MNKKMKGNKVKAEENILKWVIDKKKHVLKTEGFTLLKEKMGLI